MAVLVSVCRSAVKRLFSSKYLLVTNTVSYGLLMGFADCAVQTVERQIVDKEQRKFKRHDWERTGKKLIMLSYSS
jgi:hypothetical protein